MDTMEIYQAVLDECMDKIEKIKNEYGNELTDIITKRIKGMYSSKISELEAACNKLSKKVDKLESMVHQKNQEISRLTKGISNGNSSNSTSYNSSSSTRSYRSESDTKNISKSNSKYNLYGFMKDRKYFGYDTFEFAGWVYYPNEKMGNYLYRARPDGSDEQQLTNYSVTSVSFSRVEDGILYFHDAEFKLHSLKII